MVQSCVRGLTSSSRYLRNFGQPNKPGKKTPQTGGRALFPHLRQRSRVWIGPGILLPAPRHKSGRTTGGRRNASSRSRSDCWFCQGVARMSRSHVLLYCPNASLAAARMEAWEGKNPGVLNVGRTVCTKHVCLSEIEGVIVY